MVPRSTALLSTFFTVGLVYLVMFVTSFFRRAVCYVSRHSRPEIISTKSSI
jgi:hypothetical protein